MFKEGNSGPHYTQVTGHGQHPHHLQYTEDGICFWEEGIIKLVKDEQSEAINNKINVKLLEGAWEVFFPEGWGAPERVIFPKLKSWTESEKQKN